MVNRNLIRSLDDDDLFADLALLAPEDEVEEWMIETGTPNTLIRRGLTKESLPKGTEIVVDGYQSKDGSRRANGRDLTLPNGQTLFLGSSGTGAPYDKK